MVAPFLRGNALVMSTLHLRSVAWLPFGLLVATAAPAAAETGVAPTPDDPYADAPTPDDPYAAASARKSPEPPQPLPDAKASSGPPREALVLGGIGGIVAAVGGVFLSLGTTGGDDVKTGVGVTTLLAGVGLGIGGFGWYFNGPNRTPSDARRRAPLPLYVRVAPSPRGLWAGVSGQF
jgi:hypothetical protein